MASAVCVVALRPDFVFYDLVEVEVEGAFRVHRISHLAGSLEQCRDGGTMSLGGAAGAIQLGTLVRIWRASSGLISVGALLS